MKKTSASATMLQQTQIKPSCKNLEHTKSPSSSKFLNFSPCYLHLGKYFNIIFFSLLKKYISSKRKIYFFFSSLPILERCPKSVGAHILKSYFFTFFLIIIKFRSLHLM